MLHAHITAGARAFDRLVRDDRDRWDLLARLRAALAGEVLAWCIMDTHLHVVVAQAGETCMARLSTALGAYVRSANRRHGRQGSFLRGPAVPIEVPGAFELGRTIRYVHENPVSAGLVSRPDAWPWSSAREYAGLIREHLASVERARRLVDPRALRLLEAPAVLADARPVEVPVRTPAALLAAAAQVLSVAAEDVATGRRDRAACAARALFIRLGTLEGYQHRQLAPVLGVTRQRVGQYAALHVDVVDVRRARALLRRELLPAGQIQAPSDVEGALDLPRRQGSSVRAPS